MVNVRNKIKVKKEEERKKEKLYLH